MTARVRSCLEETFKIDDKMSTRTFKLKKSVVPLKEDHTFQEEEEVIIIRQKNCNSIMIKELEHEKIYLKKQIKELEE